MKVATSATAVRPIRQRGYNLIELMIALALSATLIGAVMMAVSGTGLTGRSQNSMAALSESGQIAMNILSTHIRMAGFRRPNEPLDPNDTETPWLFGCDSGFASISAAFNSLSCSTTAGNDAIAVRYDARETGASTDTPVDCLGANGTPLPDGIADNRFYIATGPSGNPGLYCRGNGGGTGQMLVENVETMQLRYGVAGVFTAPSDDPNANLYTHQSYTGQTARYEDADDLSIDCKDADTEDPPPNSWCAVTSVRVCLIVRSDDRTTEEENTPYTDCDGNEASVADRRLRRAMITTISLRNRTVLPAVPVPTPTPSPTP